MSNRPRRKLFQAIVRSTHSWPGPKHLYRLIYRRAAQAAAGLAHRKSIVGIYARNSYALGTWVAGISDIDLTVVWRNAAAAEIDDFYARYDALRGRFPMLGEVEMLEERHVAAWSSQGIPGLEARRWLSLSESPPLPVRYLGCEALDRLRHAAAIYHYNLSPLFASAHPDAASFRRFAAKLFRQLEKPLPRAASPGRLMAACLQELSAKIAAFPFDHDGPTVDYAALLGAPCPAAQRRPFPADSSSLTLLGRVDDASPRYRIVSPGTEDLASAMPPAIATDPVVLRFYLCFVDPLEYFTLLLGRTVFSGADPLADPFPLSRRALHHSILHYTVQMLTFPYNRELPEAEFRNILYGWFLRTLRYLEDGRMEFDYRRLRDYFGRRHLETETRCRRRLLLGIADDLAPHLLASETGVLD